MARLKPPRHAPLPPVSPSFCFALTARLPSPRPSYWNLLFFVILLAVMWLWRPTINNQRYAYSALEGTDEDEEDFDVCWHQTCSALFPVTFAKALTLPRFCRLQIVPNFQQDTMKMRSLSARGQPASPRDADDDEVSCSQFRSWASQTALSLIRPPPFFLRTRTCGGWRRTFRRPRLRVPTTPSRVFRWTLMRYVGGPWRE